MNNSRRRGLTLIETLVVLIVIGIIAALIGRTVSRPADEALVRRGLTSLAQVIAAEQRFAAANGTFTVDPSTLRLSEQVVAVSGPSTDDNQVSIGVGPTGTLALAVFVDAADVCLVRRLPAPTDAADRIPTAEQQVRVEDAARCDAAGLIWPGDQ